MRVIVTGGGTGGHLYPAMAVIEALQKDPDVTAVLYIGNKNKKEAELVPQSGIPFAGIEFSGMPRKFSFAFIRWAISFVAALGQAYYIVKDFKPDVAIGTGGYVTAPVLMAAKSQGVPFVVHEPDALPGVVNRILSTWATAATCAFEGARQHLKTKQLTVTGNPLRSTIGVVSREAARQNLGVSFQTDKPVLLVVGGSQGAKQINQAVLGALPRLIDELGFQVIHQTGEKLYLQTLAECLELYKAHPSYLLLPFITDMASALALADIALCRSGSMSLSEMLRAHVPMLLVPYPYAAQDHQTKNALAMQEAGAALMIEDQYLTAERLLAVLSELNAKPEVLSQMKQACSLLAKPQATLAVVNVLKSIAKSQST